MTKRQIIHALRLVDDLHRIKNEKRPGAIVVLRTSLEDVMRAQRSHQSQ